MARPLWLVVSCLVPLGAVAADKAAPAKKSPEVIARGEYLVTFGGCNDCHTPWKLDDAAKMPVPDMTRMLSGHPEKAPDPEGTVGAHDIGLIGPTFTSFKLPFGTVYAANITSDKETGIGSWTEEMFVRALRTGKHLGGTGRAILPPMPWMDFAKLTDADLSAMFAFLQSTKPIRNVVPQPKVPQDAIDGVTKGYDSLTARMKKAK